MVYCIYCTVDPVDSEWSSEHIIPRVLGGWATMPLVCKHHNETLGRKIESSVKRNAYLAVALDKLGIQAPDEAYSEGTLEVEFPNKNVMGVRLDPTGEPEFVARRASDGILVIPAEEAEATLKKRLQRYQKRTGKRIKFDWESLKRLSEDEVHRIPGTNICFRLRTSIGGDLYLLGLNEPISFELPAKMALTHFTAVAPNLAPPEAFVSIKRWLLFGGTNRFVLLRTRLNGKTPSECHYHPYHHLYFRLSPPRVLAIVSIFGLFKFLIDLGCTSVTPVPEEVEKFRWYHLYDLRKKRLLRATAPSEWFERDNGLLRRLESFTDWQ